MTDLHVLWLTHKGDGYVGAPQTQYGFEQEAAKLCECKFAGEGWPDYVAGESMEETVERVMPDADWVIDKDNNLHNKKPQNRRYKMGHFISDLHGKHHYNIHDPMVYTDLLNSVGYDAVFMRYPLLYGTKYRPEVVYERLTMAKHWVPWSVDADWFHPKHKDVDVSLIGTVGKCYPLRKQMWGNLDKVCASYRLLKQKSPSGKTYERSINSLLDTHLVGEKYRDALAKTRILCFGCSVYRYMLQKFFEAPASQCLVFSNKPSMAKRLGFIDGKTYVEATEGNWMDKLTYLLENPNMVRQIARNGMKNVLINHTHRTRAKQWLEMIQ